MPHPYIHDCISPSSTSIRLRTATDGWPALSQIFLFCERTSPHHYSQGMEAGIHRAPCRTSTGTWDTCFRLGTFGHHSRSTKISGNGRSGMGKNLDSDRKFFCVTCFHVVRAVRCADSLFSRLDGYSGQSGQIQNAQNPARMIKKEPSNLQRTPLRLLLG